jgi:outer membrane autotransporter protein
VSVLTQPCLARTQRATLLTTASWLAIVAFGCLGAGAQARAADGPAQNSSKALSSSYRPLTVAAFAAVAGSGYGGDPGCIIPQKRFDPSEADCEKNFIKNQDGVCIRRENVCGAGLPGQRMSQSGALTIGRATTISPALRQSIETRLDVGDDSGPSGVAVASAGGDTFQLAHSSAGQNVSQFAIWGQAHGLRSTFDTDDDRDFLAKSHGALIGVDFRADSRTIVGVAFEGNRMTLRSQGGDDADVRYRHLALYAGRRWDRAFAHGTVFAGQSNGSTNGVDDPDPFSAGFAIGKVSGDHFGASLKAGYRFDTPFAAIEPIAGLDYVHATQDAFTQTTDLGFADQHFDAAATDNARVSLAGRFSKHIALTDGVALRLRAELGWAHYFGDEASLTSRAWGYAPVTLTAPADGDNAITAKLGASLGLGQSVSFYFDATREERGSETSTGAAFGGKVQF